MNIIPHTGYMRLKQIIGARKGDSAPPLIPVSATTWWKGVKSGRFPPAVKLGPRTTAWRAEDISALIRRLGSSPS